MRRPPHIAGASTPSRRRRRSSRRRRIRRRARPRCSHSPPTSRPRSSARSPARRCGVLVAAAARRAGRRRARVRGACGRRGGERGREPGELHLAGGHACAGDVDRRRSGPLTSSIGCELRVLGRRASLVRVLARRRAVRTVQLATGVRGPGGWRAQVRGACGRRGGKRGHEPGGLRLARRYRRPGDVDHVGAARRSRRTQARRSRSTADEPGVVRVLARRRGVRRVRLAAGVRRPGGRRAQLRGAGNRRGGQRRRVACKPRLARRHRRPGDADHIGAARPSRRARARRSRSRRTRRRSFECSLDGAPFAACEAPQDYVGLAGEHSVEVRAIDEAGNVDTSPASYAWRVDTTGARDGDRRWPRRIPLRARVRRSRSPLTSLARSSARSTRRRSRRAARRRSTSISSTAPTSFEVRAVDDAGNADASPASFAWTGRHGRRRRR